VRHQVSHPYKTKVTVDFTEVVLRVSHYWESKSFAFRLRKTVKLCYWLYLTNLLDKFSVILAGRMDIWFWSRHWKYLSQSSLKSLHTFWTKFSENV